MHKFCDIAATEIYWVLDYIYPVAAMRNKWKHAHGAEAEEQTAETFCAQLLQFTERKRMTKGYLELFKG